MKNLKGKDYNKYDILKLKKANIDYAYKYGVWNRDISKKIKELEDGMNKKNIF